MENKALYDFINEACKQDDTDIDISIAELTSAIHTLEKEKEKREDIRRQKLIDAFEEAYKELRKAHIRIRYDIETELVDTAEYYRQPYELDEFDCFSFI